MNKNQAGYQAQVNQQRKRSNLKAYNFEFRGSSIDYFCFWIVNICLSFVTFGIYSAWGKVQKEKYFAGQTFIANAPLDFSAHAHDIFRYRAILIGATIAIFASLPIHYLLSITLITAAFLLSPWLKITHTFFLTAHTSYQNLNIEFSGHESRPTALFWYVSRNAILAAIIIACIVMWHHTPEAKTFIDKINHIEAKLLSFNILQISIISSVIGLSFLVSAPMADFMRAKFIIESCKLGKNNCKFTATASDYFKIYLINALIIISGLLSSLAAFDLAKWLSAACLCITLIISYTYHKSQTRNLILNNTKIKGIHFRSRVKFLDLLQLYCINILAITASIGLLIPWAHIQTKKYFMQQTQLITTDNIMRVLQNSTRTRVDKSSPKQTATHQTKHEPSTTNPSWPPGKPSLT